MYRVFALIALCALTGCARAQLEHQAESVNRASGSTMPEQVLLNAVRASLDLPMSFTKLQKYVANGMVSTSLSPKVPFGPEAVNSNDLGPSVAWNPGVFQIEYADVNTAGALTKLNENLGYDAIDRYARDGLPGSVIFTVFASYVEVHRDIADALKSHRSIVCSNTRMAKYKDMEGFCDELSRIERIDKCKLWYAGDALTLENNQEFYVVENHARDKCGFLTFRSLGLMLRIANYSTDLIPGKEKKKIRPFPT